MTPLPPTAVTGLLPRGGAVCPGACVSRRGVSIQIQPQFISPKHARFADPKADSGLLVAVGWAVRE